MKKLSAIIFTTVFLLAAADIHCAEVIVSAAASLRDALKEIAASYEKQSGDKIIYNFSASSLLARQIEAGAPVDIFFSADEARMDQLQNKDLLLKETRQSRLSNSLVVVVPSGSSIAGPEDLRTRKVKRLALADPRTVPAGIYAKEYLQKKNLWPAIQDKIIPTENVRAALAAVEGGNADAAVVYKTDALISKKVKVAYEVPPAQTPNISYCMAVLKEARSREAARKFLQYLASDPAGKVFQKYGFLLRN
jgi:molybdate transport system substrate-binding protein